MTKQTEIKTTGLFCRTVTLERGDLQSEDRTLPIAFSSETPVERNFGTEILDHRPESVRLGRLNNSGPVLVNHHLDDQVGVVESARIDPDKFGRAEIRFGKSERAEEIFRDVQDGIRTQVSVGYAIHKMEQTQSIPPVYRVTDFEPYELSIVSSGADQAVGVGRDAEQTFQTEITKLRIEMDEKIEVTEERVDTTQVVAKARAEEIGRVREIESYGREHKQTELAEEYIKSGKSAGEFACAVLQRYQQKPADHANIGLTQKETRKFSWMRLINHMAKPGDEKARREAEFEIDACIAAEKQQGRAARGYIIPMEVLNDPRIKTRNTSRYAKRELLAGSGDGANLVPTILDASSFIEFLDNSMVTVRAGATVLRGLDGIIKIPRRDAAITGGWLAESADAADTTPSYDQVSLSLKTYGLRVDLSRQLRLQSSMDVESLIASEIALSCALAVDKAAMTGPGTGNAPTGVGVQSGVGIQALATINQITWAEAIGLQSDVMTANAFFGDLAYAIHPVLAGDAKSRSRDSGSGRYVMENGEIDGYPAYISAQVADLGTGGANNAIFGNWRDCLIGYWGASGIDVQIHREFDDGRIRLLVFVDADCNVRHPGSFSRTSNP